MAQDQASSTVDEVLRAGSFYEILGVKYEEFSSSGLRKAYLKRSMHCHPDKTDHPRATEAFQKVAEAYDTLSDVEKRTQYDLRTKKGTQPNNVKRESMDFSVDQAFQMFAEAMQQYGRDQGIEFQRKDTFFDSIASAVLFVDSLMTNHNASFSDGTESGERQPGDEPPMSRLQGFAKNLMTMGSIFSTASQIIQAQKNRSMEEEENGDDHRTSQSYPSNSSSTPPQPEVNRSI